MIFLIASVLLPHTEIASLFPHICLVVILLSVLTQLTKSYQCTAAITYILNHMRTAAYIFIESRRLRIPDIEHHPQLLLIACSISQT